MKECRDCRGQVSKSAKRCPHCGCKYPAMTRLRYAANGWMGVLVLVVLFLMIFLSPMP